MTDNNQRLTTADVSKATGLSVSAITRLLRQGKLSGEKRGGKWAIAQEELARVVSSNQTDDPNASTTAGPVRDGSPEGRRSYSVEGFAAMTYLTERGVRQWLTSGRLHSHTDAAGNRRVDATNLEHPDIKRLIRK